MKVDITQRMRAVDDYLKTLKSPRHRAIIQNYRRHAMLEVSGYWEDILVPEMTVAEPTYRFHTPKGLQVLSGMNAVRSMYAGLVKENSTVIYHTDEYISVGDWGFSTEYVSHRFWPGSVLAGMGHAIDDLSATYLVSMSQMMCWPYDENALMKEERVYRGADLKVRRADPAEIITVEECREKLMPLVPPVEECSLLHMR